MSKLRSVSTGFWSDPFIEDLTPNEKLLFLYLITNEKTNMLGIYESSIKKICFETGLQKETVSKALKSFEKLKKVKYKNNYVILINYLKHQNFNTNMKKSAIDVYNDLPKELKNNKITVSKSNPSEGFESLLNHFGMVPKIEVEYEKEEEEEREKPLKPKPVSLVHQLRLIFESHYKNEKGIEYYYEAKDAKALKSLSTKLKKLITDGGREDTDAEIKDTFERFLTAINNEWIKDNLSLTILNSKYNELIAEIRAGKKPSGNKQVTNDELAIALKNRRGRDS